MADDREAVRAQRDERFAAILEQLGEARRRRREMRHKEAERSRQAAEEIIQGINFERAGALIERQSRRVPAAGSADGGEHGN